MCLVEFKSRFIPQAYKWQKQKKNAILMHDDHMNIMIIQRI